MGNHLRIAGNSAKVLPFDQLAPLLRAIPSLPRPMLEHLIERAIDHMDRQDGDPDLEDDDPAGDPLDTGEYDEAALLEPPRYGVDQTLGPVNEREAIATYERRLT